MAIVVEWFPALSTGDFMITVRGEGRGVCQRLAVESPQLIKVQWWLTRDDDFSTHHCIPLPPLLDASSYPNECYYVLQRCNTECFEALSAVSSISVNDIIDLAFVFHVDSLENHWVIAPVIISN
jgi:hypothetical protein